MKRLWSGLIFKNNGSYFESKQTICILLCKNNQKALIDCLKILKISARLSLSVYNFQCFSDTDLFQTEPEFLNFQGAQESIPKKPIPSGCVLPGGPVRQSYSYSVPIPHRLFKNSSTDLRYIFSCPAVQHHEHGVARHLERADRHLPPGGSRGHAVYHGKGRLRQVSGTVPPSASSGGSWNFLRFCLDTFF